MDVISTIKTRRSIRAYLPRPVPREIIRDIMSAAERTPSAVNTQPWEITIVTGKILDEIRQDNVAYFTNGIPIASSSTPYEGVYKRRRIELAMDLFELIGIQREDQEKRIEWQKQGFRFFDAPVAIIISADKSLRYTLAMFDIGCMAQTICLAAMQFGLGTCIEKQGVLYPDVIRKYTGIGEDKDIIIGIAVGYPDPDFPANKLISRRESASTYITWLGF